MKNDKLKILFDFSVRTVNSKGKTVKNSGVEKWLVRTVRDLVPELILFLCPDLDTQNKIKELNKKLYKQ